VNPLVELNLALLLFLPWFAILGALYWWYPRRPRHGARIVFDVVALLASLLAFLLGVHWAHAHADPIHGRMWPQLLAVALGYGVFLATLAAAFLLRRRWLRGS
jgi:lipopolysaccharide export LptBFGC system permease protein LptF